MAASVRILDDSTSDTNTNARAFVSFHGYHIPTVTKALERVIRSSRVCSPEASEPRQLPLRGPTGDAAAGASASATPGAAAELLGKACALQRQPPSAASEKRLP